MEHLRCLIVEVAGLGPTERRRKVRGGGFGAEDAVKYQASLAISREVLIPPPQPGSSDCAAVWARRGKEKPGALVSAEKN